MNAYRTSAGRFTCSFGVFSLTGSDVGSFLQNQSTFDTSLIHDHEFHLVSFLDPQGRIECYGWMLHAGSEWMYLVPINLKEVASERLNRFLISEDVTISGPILESWTCIVGTKAFSFNTPSAFKGEMFSDASLLLKETSMISAPEISFRELHLWQGLTGWPSFVGDNFKKELITNSRLFDLSVSLNKGCYPGQETVSKITTRRGAAYSPVLLESKSPIQPGPVSNFDKKIGDAHESYEWKGLHYLSADLLRDFRVEGMKLPAKVGDQEATFVVRYFPLISGDSKLKADEFFYEGADFFKHSDEVRAEESFKLALEIDPEHADTLESLGVLLGRQGRFAEAIELMKKLSIVSPDSVLAHTNMSIYLMKLGNIEAAEEQKSLATVKSFQKFGAEAKEKNFQESEKKKKHAEWEQRESMFKQVLEIDEEDTLANYGLGSIAVEKGEWLRARTHLEKVLKADPTYSVAYLALGKAYSALGEKSLAKLTYSDGIKTAAAKGDLMPANQMQFELDRL